MCQFVLYRLRWNIDTPRNPDMNTLKVIGLGPTLLSMDPYQVDPIKNLVILDRVWLGLYWFGLNIKLKLYDNDPTRTIWQPQFRQMVEARRARDTSLALEIPNILVRAKQHTMISYQNSCFILYLRLKIISSTSFCIYV